LAGETTRQVLPTATGFAAKEAITILREHDVAIAPLLQRAGLSEQGFARTGSDDNVAAMQRLSAIGQCKFLEYAAEATGDSAFGLHLAGQVDPHDTGIFIYVGSAAADVGEALALYSRYSRIVNEAFRQKFVRRSGCAGIEVEFAGLPRYAARQNTEFVLGCFKMALRVLTGRNVAATTVTFSHSRNSDLREFERFFGCPVEFGAQADLLALSDEALRIPLITADPKLLHALKPYCEMAAKERGATTATLRSAVEAEVEKLLPHGKAKAENVAKALALSLRTLARRLADEGATYGEVVDQLRRSLAAQYLNDPGMSLGQIAWLLGYEGSTSFNHAFKRWTGRSPSLARNQKQLPAPG
jgi:AraC-like DNA-binding protein